MPSRAIPALALVAVIAMSLPRAGAEAPTKESAPPQDSVTLQGCVKGPVFKQIPLSSAYIDGKMTFIRTYRLSGEKALLKRMKKDTGFVFEVAGVVREAAADPRGGYSTSVGKTRITIGGATSGMAPAPPPADQPTLVVDSFERLSMRCR